MIKKLRISDETNTPIGWWDKVEALKGISEWEFEPEGLTILWGPNGVGKSTVLRLMARLTHCEQGGVPKFTRQSIDAFKDGFGSSAKVKDGARLLADGQPAYFFDPAAKVGLFGGGGAFDDDFFTMGVMQATTLNKISSGQFVNSMTARLFKEAVKAEKPDMKELARWTRSEDHKKAAGQGLTKTTRGKKTGRITIMLDEPARSLDIKTQAEVWHILSHQTRFQLIVATHNPFALWIDKAKYIDLKPGYLNQCRAEMLAYSLRVVSEHRKGVDSKRGEAEAD